MRTRITNRSQRHLTRPLRAQTTISFSRYALTYISSGQSTRPLPLEHLDEGDPEAFGETAVDQEVDGRVHDEEEVVHITCGVS